MNRAKVSGIGLVVFAFSGAVLAECSISEESKTLDPVEAGFCESDVVFVGHVSNRVETIRAYREEGSDRTKHFRIEVSTVKVVTNYKDASSDKVTMTADLYDKKGPFSFVLEQDYLVFGKRVPGKDEYAGTSAACSVQPTLPLADAKDVIERLEQHRKGAKKIDCKNIRKKA